MGRKQGAESMSGKRGKTRSPNATTFSLEPLEPRVLLSGDGLLAGLVGPEWFEMLSGGAFDPSATEEVSWEDGVVEAVQDQWIVNFTESAMEGVDSVAGVAGLLTGGIVDFDVLEGLGMAGWVLLQTTDAAVDNVQGWLSGNSNVEYFSPNFIVSVSATPDDPLFDQLWGLDNVGQVSGTKGADIDATSAWNLERGSSDIVVAVIDTGVDYMHPDLIDNMWVNALEFGGTPGVDDDLNGFIDDIYGWDFYDDDADPFDEVGGGHGTHVAGTIGAVGDNGIGVVGVNWDVSIMAVRFLGAGGGTAAGAIASVNYVTMMKSEFDDGAGDGTPGADVRVINASYGGGGYDAGEEAAIQAFGAVGGLFVAAAGNDYSSNDIAPAYPTSYDSDNIISVAATDRNDALADFSNYGVESVDLGAPGVAIMSTVPSWTGQLYDNTYSGTSMAAPHVAGVAALAWAYNPSATMEQVRDAILSGVDPLPSLAGMTITGGRLNARATLERVMYADPLTIQRQVLTSGPATVTVYDVLGRVDVGTSDVSLRLGRRDPTSIKLTIGGSGGGMGLVVRGATNISSIGQGRGGRRGRRGGSVQPMAFIALDSPVDKISLKTGLAGYDLNDQSLGGMVFGADLDGDGVLNDHVALYSTEYVGSVTLGGHSAGDFLFMENGPSLGSFSSSGDVGGDFLAADEAGSIQIGGDYRGNANFNDDLGTFSVGSYSSSSRRRRRRSSSTTASTGELIGDVTVMGDANHIRFHELQGVVDVGETLYRLSATSLGEGAYIRAGEEIRNVWVIKDMGACILMAPTIDSVGVGGNMTGALLMAGADLGDDWEIGGSGADADTFLPGTIRSVHVGVNITDSVIGAGLMPVGGELDLAAMQAQETFLYGSLIRKVSFGGELSASSSLSGIGSYAVWTVEWTNLPEDEDQPEYDSVYSIA